MPRRASAWMLVVLAAAMVAGCEINRRNYDQVNPGMAPEDVERILGAPRYKFADEWVYTRDDPRDLTKVTVHFEDEVVVGKAWQNPEKPWENDREGRRP